MKPNILIIYTDQQRFDTLGCNGNTLIKTPHIDAMAQAGTNITDCHVSCPICTPSRVALFSGQWGIANGSIANSREMQMKESNQDMLQYLKQHGYETALIGKNHCFHAESNDLYFDHAYEADHLKVSKPRNDEEHTMCKDRVPTMQLAMAQEKTAPSASITNWLADHTIDYLQQEREKPFCCWLSIPDPHPPYMVCEPYASMYDDVDVPGPIYRDGEMDNKPARQRIAVEIDRLSAQYPDPEDIIKLRRTYWGMVSQIDDAVGRIMAQLKESGQDKNTIVLFTSDHGDYMGDHKLVRKGVDCYSATTHVPMLWQWVDQIKPQEHNCRVSNVDIFPTLCDLIDVPVPDTVQGRSYADLLRGDADQGRRLVFSHHGRPGDPIQSIPDTDRDKLVNDNFLLSKTWYQGRCFTVRDDKWAYTMTPGDVDELYDRKNDPHELYNVADQEKHYETVKTMRGHLVDWLSDCLVH